MDSFELNKIMGAVLGALLFAVGLNIFSGDPLHAEEARRSRVRPSGPAGGDCRRRRAGPGAGQPLPVLLAERGRQQGPERGQEMRRLPHLRQGRPEQGRPEPLRRRRTSRGLPRGLQLLGRLKAKGGEWTYEEIDKFIKNPKADVPGTIMAFAGVPSRQERADILAYLRTLSDNPVPLPTP